MITLLKKNLSLIPEIISESLIPKFDLSFLTYEQD